MNKLLSSLTAFLLIAMIALVVLQVFTRYVLNNPTVFTEELVRIALIWTGFLGAAYAFGTRQHMALIFLKEKFEGALKKHVCIFIDFVILVFAVIVLIVGGYKLSADAMLIKTPVLGLPRGLVYMAAPVAGIFIMVYQIINIKENFEMGD
jgi:TRAP-type C4-dicarboxylate transport system permease small subunit